MEKWQLYLELFKEYRNEIRHQEIQRSTVSTICVALASGLIALIFKEPTASSRPLKSGLGLLLLNFSVIAIIMLRKLYERFSLGRHRAKLYLAKIDDFSGFPEDSRLADIWKQGERWGEVNYPYLSFIRLHYLWEALLMGAAAVGVFVLIHYSEEPLWKRLLLLAAGPALQLAIFYLVLKWETSKPEVVHRTRKPPHWMLGWLRDRIERRKLDRQSCAQPEESNEVSCVADLAQDS